MSTGEGQPATPDFVRATLAPMTDAQGRPLSPADKGAQAVEVQFNPETLDITLSNNFKKSTGDSPVQLVDEATAQLRLDLQFDTTHTGVDVRQDTGRIAAFLRPLDTLVEAGRKERLPPPKVVEFEWGAIVFQGYIDSYSESLEFFSADGVPLRAKVTMSLSQQERSFEPRGREGTGEGAASGAPFSAAGVGADPFAGGAAESPADPGAPLDNAAAAANGVENPRQPGLDTVSLPTAGGKLGRGPAAFATAAGALGGGVSGGLGLSAGAGIGLSAGAQAGIGASAGFGASAGVGAGAGLGSAAGVGTAGAFAGLSVKPPKFELKPVEIPKPKPPASPAGKVGLGGAVKARGGASLSAKVGAKITFGSE